MRRAWLWGYDEYAGKDYSHRKTCVVDRLRELDRVFAIQVCALAVLSNHYHLVLHVDQARARQWSEREVVRRCKQLFAVPTLVQRYCGSEPVGRAEQDAAKEIIAKWRSRLMDVSWYKRSAESLPRRYSLKLHD